MYMNGPRRSDILEVLKAVKEAFFGQGLWDRFLDQRTSLSWIDTNVKDGSDDQLKAYRSVQIHPGLGVKMSKENWQAIPSTPIGINTEIVRPVNILWSGDLVCARSSHFICSVDVSEVTDSNDESISDIDQIESIQVIKRVPSRLLSLNLHTLHTTNAMMCFPQSNDEEDCKHASYLIRSLQAKNDALYLKVTFIRDCDEEGAEELGVEHNQGSIDASIQQRNQYTRFALLIPTTFSTAMLEVLGEDQTLDFDVSRKQVDHSMARSFCTAMMEKSWSTLGAYVDKVDDQPKAMTLYRLEEIPSGFSSIPLRPQVPSTPTKQKLPSSKPMPGEIVTKAEDHSSNIENARSIDDPCLGIRKAYLKYLYRDETVSDYVRRLNSASKDITALAAKQGIPLKEAQQKLVAFIIEFLRIWPSKMGSKYKQISKELNIGRGTESKSQDNYVILDDERAEFDIWKAYAMRSVKDEDVRLSLRKLKTKDTQIQIVQNLHILLLIDKFGLEENKPFKKDPGAHKVISLFMDELCIAASIEDIPLGLMSPQTPRSKDLDPAKKFFTRVVARFYESTLPKIVSKLAIKCGVETGLLSSPGPSRVSKRSGIKRSASLGVLQKPRQLDFSAAILAESADTTSSNLTSANQSKNSSHTARQSSVDHSTRSVLNSSIFRNRQVAMTRGSAQGVSMPTLPSNPIKEASGSTKASSGPVRSKSTSAIETLEDEDAPPKIAKLKLKQFYHDKESEEVLKLFRRQRPLSKADMPEANPFVISGSVSNIPEEEDDDDDDNGDLGELGKYLRNGTTSWGVIRSTNKSMNDSDILKSPSRGAAQRRGSPKKKRDTSPLRQYSSLSSSTSSLPSLSLPSETVVPSTPLSSQRYGYQRQSPSRSPSTPSRRAQLRRHQSQQSFFSKNIRLNPENDDIIPDTPSKRAQMQKDKIFASQIRGNADREHDMLGSPSKRRRGGITSEDEDDNDIDFDNKLRRTPSSPSLSQYRRSQNMLRSPTFSRYLQPDSFFSNSRTAEHLSGPDRKKIHMESGSSTGNSKIVLVPNTPTASISSLDSALSLRNGTSPSKAENSGFLLSTPKSSGFNATSDMYIGSPTPVKQSIRRNIDYSLFSADD
ncbi:hypothetical protein BGZ76_007791 [Entomortierella beljakovae]|nr:hypothetical protein BGZ76_007791 [Entomortierella beljakovae]